MVDSHSICGVTKPPKARFTKGLHPLNCLKRHCFEMSKSRPRCGCSMFAKFTLLRKNTICLMIQFSYRLQCYGGHVQMSYFAPSIIELFLFF